MILFVDNEHASGYEKPWGEKLLAARTRIKYRLEDISGDLCLMARYFQITPALIEQYDIRAMFISGNSADPAMYDPAEQAGMRAIIRDGQLPIFGFCGGFQLMGETLGAVLDKIGPLDEGVTDPFPDAYPGMKKEFGYASVDITANHPLTAGLDPHPIVRHAHSLELKGVPAGFEVLASTAVAPIQMMVHTSRPLAGSQFHPEYYTDEHPAGRIMIANFCRWVGVI